MKGEERRLVHSLQKIDQLLSSDQWKPISRKDSTESSKLRSQGNRLYNSLKDMQYSDQIVHHAEILILYTRAAAFAHSDSLELALALGNRSALLCHLGRYEDCIVDIDRALLLPISDSLKTKYLVRKVECQAALGKIEVEETCEETKILLQNLDIDIEEKKDLVLKLVQAMIRFNKKEFEPSHVVWKFEETSTGRKFSKNLSAEVPDASIALQINYESSAFGRHVKADREIIPGEVLFAGRPYVSLPMESRSYSHCSHCLSFLWSGLPCPGCTLAVYCGEACMIEARQMYHEIECLVAGRARRKRECGNAGRLLALRILLMAIREFDGDVQGLRKEFEAIDVHRDHRTKGFSDNHSVFVNNYKSIYSLSHNMTKKAKENLNWVSEDSAVLLYLLARYTKVFRKYFDYDERALATNDTALFIGKLLSRYQHIVLINASSVVKDAGTEVSTDWNWIIPQEESSVGLYLTSFLSLLNHSCHPNVAKCEAADHQSLLYAIRPIAKDEQIFISYGPMYFEMSHAERQKLLTRFHFECNCVACEKNWPVFKDIIQRNTVYCSLSRSAIDATLQAQKKCNKIFESLRDGSFDGNSDTVEDLAHAIMLTTKYTQLPNDWYATIITTLIAVFTKMFGYIIGESPLCS
ncbi:hypothetical protein QAD02_009038 [Eretmocerus hayati]|uniref:Uncharacterized protein n=1 Tax=Eretmocerus hayati TaxID=131215 RepID=A0ACC2N9L2_9HYME|nr:hypothetical protein QAD02_009038 [Eretmocerus hayati]